MIKLNKKTLALFTGVTLFTTSLFPIAWASTGKKMMELAYSNIKILYNNQPTVVDKEPFIINGTTYVSVRSMANIFNKNIAWDGTTSTILITDKADPMVDNLKAQIEGKNFQISQKDAEITALKSEIQKLKNDTSKSSSSSLATLEDDLNDDYYKYKNVRFKIYLSGNKNSIDVKIDVNLRDYRSEWNLLTSANKTDYLQDIVDDVLREYKNADITGYIRDTDSSSKLLTFSVNSSGTVKLNSTSSSTTSLSDLQKTLDDDYYNYFSSKGIYFESIKLEGDKDDIAFDIYLDYNRYKSKWDSLSSSAIEDLMKEVFDDIQAKYKNAYISGYIYDSYNKKYLSPKCWSTTSGGYFRYSN